jgi:hypothetical protein
MNPYYDLFSKLKPPSKFSILTLLNTTTKNLLSLFRFTIRIHQSFNSLTPNDFETFVLIKKLEEEILELNSVWKRDLKKIVSDFKFKIGAKQGGDQLFMKIDEISKFELEEVNLVVDKGVNNRWDSRQSST